MVEDLAVCRRGWMAMFSQRRNFGVSVCSSSAVIDGSAHIPHGVVVVNAVTWAASARALGGAIERIAAKAPVVLLGRESLLREHARLILGGNVAFATHAADERFILGAVRAAAKGEMHFENGVLLKFLVEILGAKERRGNAVDREQLVLDFVANGKTNKEIGDRLGCSERTVKACLTGLLRKTGVSKRSALASYAVSNGLARLHRESPSRHALDS